MLAESFFLIALVLLGFSLFAFSLFASSFAFVFFKTLSSFFTSFCSSFTAVAEAARAPLSLSLEELSDE